jgi:Phage protein Gp19/Gp15/Gp42
MAVATVTDVQARFERPLTDDEQTRAAVFLEDIEAQILDRITTITDALRPKAVIAEANAVVRKLRNPAGLTYESEGNYSYTLGSGASASSALALTDAEWATLGVGNAAFSVRFQAPCRRGLLPYDLIPWADA